MTVKIVDVYSGNAPLDFDELRANGYTGIIFKAGQGELADVPRVQPGWWAQALDEGFDRGWYWLKDARHRASLEVEALKAATGLDFGELGLWVDAEKPVIGMTDAQYWACAYAGYNSLYDFMQRIQQTGASRFPEAMPGIYTSPGFWALISGKMSILRALFAILTRQAPAARFATLISGVMPVASQQWFAKAPLWIAQYPWVYVPGVSKPSNIGLWPKWTLWQYREGPDVNIFNGTDEEYLAFFGGTAPEPPAPPPSGGTMQAQELLGKTVTVRTSPQAISGNSSSETIAPHAIVDYVAIVDDQSFPGDPTRQWLQLTGTNRFVNYIYPPNGARFTLLSSPPPQPPPAGVTITGATVHTTAGDIEMVVKS